jgi:murein DD-endopeptidase MepM/ murein hydrolase activator NlpD
MLQHPVRHWLSFRIRLVCAGIFLVGTVLPPFVPKDAQANGETLEEVQIDVPQVMLVEDGFLMKSSSLTQQGSRRAYATGIIHIVQSGDSVEKIASKYSIKPETIRWANSLTDGSVIKPGQELVILPVDGVLHTVTRGQTLTRIAQLYDVQPSEIARQNGIQGGFILAGQELIIPGARPIVATPTQVATTPKPGTPAAKPTPPSPGKPTGVTATPTAGILQMPCEKCAFTQYFNAGHYAVDIQEKGGGPVFAAEAGTVIRADTGWNGGYGNVIEVDHGNGLVTLYAHNKELYVKVGDKVARGQEVSWMGNTGRVYGKTGIHVHFEVRVNGVKKNPLLYLK